MEEDTSEVAAPRNTTKPVATSKWDGVLEAISANTPTTCPRRRRTRPAAAAAAARTEAEEGTTRRTETDTGRRTPAATPTAEVGRIDDERRVRRRITLAVVVVEKFIYNFTIVFVALRSKKAM